MKAHDARQHQLVAVTSSASAGAQVGLLSKVPEALTLQAHRDGPSLLALLQLCSLPSQTSHTLSPSPPSVVGVFLTVEVWGAKQG